MNRALHYLKLVKEIHYDTYLHSLRVAMLAYNIGEIIINGAVINTDEPYFGEIKIF